MSTPPPHLFESPIPNPQSRVHPRHLVCSFHSMAKSKTNPSANVPVQSPDEPRRDRGQGGGADQEEQGISNSPDDESDADDEFEESDEEFEDANEDDSET